MNTASLVGGDIADGDDAGSVSNTCRSVAVGRGVGAVRAEEDGVIRRRADVVTEGEHAGLASRQGVVVTDAVGRVGVDDAWVTECTGVFTLNNVAITNRNGVIG